MTFSEQDKKYIERCFELARLGSGNVSPNPMVGAVIVKNGKVLSEGWHAQFGQAHAEAMAIKNAREDLTGSTLYCNLEPCNHTNKKTPPCYPLIVKSGIKRVVISNLDPNPNVAGSSVHQMKALGIDVETDVLKEKGHELNRFFFKHIKEKKPWVALKIAQSVDGKISISSAEQTWLTGEKSKKYVHSLRAEYDAVLVGANTVNIDNPRLNIREVKGRNPLKIVISGKLDLNPESNMVQLADKEKLWVFCDEKLIKTKTKNFDKAVRFIGVPLNTKGILEIDFILNFLYKENIGSLLVEGGQNVFSQFIQKDFCDEIIILQAPRILGKGLPSVLLDTSKEYNLNSVKRLGNDICFNLRKKRDKLGLKIL